MRITLSFSGKPKRRAMLDDVNGTRLMRLAVSTFRPPIAVSQEQYCTASANQPASVWLVIEEEQAGSRVLILASLQLRLKFAKTRMNGKAARVFAPEIL
jgi:hypothetical protein